MAQITDIAHIINAPKTIKIVGTVSIDGQPHTAAKQSLRLNSSGELEYVELLESSQSYRNITAAIWFNKKVSVTVFSETGECYEIIGRPDRILVAGREYEQAYIRYLDEKGYDIAAVVRIVPEKVNNLSSRQKQDEQNRSHLFYHHLDRLAITENPLN